MPLELDSLRLYAAELVRLFFLQRLTTLIIPAFQLTAIEVLDSIGCYHRDIKPENTTIKTDGHLCFIDFGVSFIAPSALVQGSTGTEGYYAPEIAKAKDEERNGGRIADIYSFGKVLNHLADACAPHPGVVLSIVAQRALNQAKDLAKKV